MGDLDFLDLRKLVPDKTLETFCEAFTPDAYYSFQKVDAVCAGSPKAWGTRMGDLHFLDLKKLVRGTTLFEASLPRGPIPDVM